MMTEGYIVKRFGQPVKRYVQILELKDDPESLASYRKLTRARTSGPKSSREYRK